MNFETAFPGAAPLPPDPTPQVEAHSLLPLSHWTKHHSLGLKQQTLCSRSWRLQPGMRCGHGWSLLRPLSLACGCPPSPHVLTWSSLHTQWPPSIPSGPPSFPSDPPSTLSDPPSTLSGPPSILSDPPSTLNGLPSVCVCTLISPSYKDASHIGSGPTLVTSFYLNHLLQGIFSQCSHILRHWGFGLQHMKCGGQTSTHNPPPHRVMFQKIA